MLYRIEPVFPLKKAPVQNTFQLLIADLQTSLKTKIIQKVPSHFQAGSYGKGLLWTEFDTKSQTRFLNVYEASTGYTKRFGPYSFDITLPFQTRQEAFWITHSRTGGGSSLHCFDSQTQTESKITLSDGEGGYRFILCGRKILSLRSKVSQDKSMSIPGGFPMTVETLAYPFSDGRRKLAELPAYPRQMFLDDDNFYYVTEEVESDWMNFSSDNRLTSKSWLRWVEIPR